MMNNHEVQSEPHRVTSAAGGELTGSVTDEADSTRSSSVVDHSAGTSKRSRVRYLDGWRGASIVAVLLGHFLPPIGYHFGTTDFDFGALGVAMFFALSGRLMAEILFVERFPLADFLFRRVSRVWPTLMLFVLTMYLCFGSVSGFLHVPLSAAVDAWLFISNYALTPEQHVAVLDHVWSLCVEEHSYVILGACALLSRHARLSAKWTVTLLTVAVLINCGVEERLGLFVSSDMYWRTDLRASAILLPSVVMFLVRPERLRSSRVFFTAFALAAATSLPSVPPVVSYTFGSICLGVAIWSIDALPRWAHAVFEAPILVWLGRLSFSIYLWQQPFYKAIFALREANMLDKLEGLLIRPVMLGLGILVGALSYKFIEQPARRLLNTWWSSRSQVIATYPQKAG